MSNNTMVRVKRIDTQTHSSRKIQRIRINVLSLMTGILLLSVCCVGFGSVITSAGDRHVNQAEEFTIYESITINNGDTLWDIAETYMPADYTVEQYINVLKNVNHLHDNTIKSGDKLIIVYNTI